MSILPDDQSASSPRTPSYARPTSSSLAKQRDRVISGEQKVGTSMASSSSGSRRVSGQGKNIRTGNEHTNPTSSNVRKTSSRITEKSIGNESKTPTAALRSVSTRAQTPYAGERAIASHEKSLASGSWGRSDLVFTNLSDPFVEPAGPSDRRTGKTIAPHEANTPEMMVPSHIPPLELTQETTPTPESPGFRAVIPSPPLLVLARNLAENSQIKTAMPDNFWLGRLSAASDHLRSESLWKATQKLTLSQSQSFFYDDSSSSEDFGSDGSDMHNDERRIARVFEFLEQFCITDEAKESLAIFKVAFEKKMELEAKYESGELERPKKKKKQSFAANLFGGVAESSKAGAGVGGGKKTGGEAKGDVKGKLSVFERLVMRKKPARKSTGGL